MSTIAEALTRLAEKPGVEILDGLRVTVFDNGVINIDRHIGDLTRTDVDATRAAFQELGYEETEAWLPRQGMSWLSDGVSVGVSFRVNKREDD